MLCGFGLIVYYVIIKVCIGDDRVKQHFRKIVVDNAEYKWLFRYDDYDYQSCPYLLIFMASYPNTTMKVIFDIKEHFILNSGLSAKYKGNNILINLNQPVFTAQIIEQCRKNGENFKHKGYKCLNELEILKEAGYEIESVFI